MSASCNHSLPRLAPDELHAGFLALLPRIVVHARISFRHLKWHQKEDAIAEAIALAWKWYVQLQNQGKDAASFSTVLAGFAARRVRGGRRLCDKEKSKDVLTRSAQARQGFMVVSLSSVSKLGDNAFDQALKDNTQTPVPDQVCFRCDFPSWRSTRSDRDRRLIDDLVVGERTGDVARKHRLSPARVAQLRREFYEDWEEFCAGPKEDGRRFIAV